MDSNELTGIQTRLTTLHSALSRLLPISKLDSHPFDHFKCKISEITETIDRLITKVNQEIEIKEKENKELYEQLENIKRKIGDRSITEYTHLTNIEICKEYLNNEMEKISCIYQGMIIEAKTIKDEIVKIKRELGLEDGKNDEGDEIDTQKLKEIKNELLEIQEVRRIKEKNKNKTLEKIKELYRKMSIDSGDDVDTKIINDKEVTVGEVERKYLDLKEKYEERMMRFTKTKREIEEMLNIIGESIERDIPKLTGDVLSEEYLTKIEIFLENLKKEEEIKFNEIFDDTEVMLKETLDIFGIEYKKYEKSKKSLKEMRNRINELQPRKELFLSTVNLIKKRNDFVKKMIDFEKVASDPKRLFKSSFQLVNEEKFRKNAVPTLLKIEEELMREIDFFESRFGKFIYLGGNYKKELEEDINGRIINKAVFINNKCETPRKKK
ncbi:hypothetical protein TCON_0109 [Astathelohania contejeani]|uniref:Uncharacterized protein n=1 Tax=Astathelohania contejeani TaxID=164912 RepID=A0ABQ7I2P2_9MICR|nr:hypothetical protein TCON_0109 [Thelohania contejeani]